jgi:hypothetical protein
MNSAFRSYGFPQLAGLSKRTHDKRRSGPCGDDDELTVAEALDILGLDLSEDELRELGRR